MKALALILFLFGTAYAQDPLEIFEASPPILVDAKVLNQVFRHLAGRDFVEGEFPDQGRFVTVKRGVKAGLLLTPSGEGLGDALLRYGAVRGEETRRIQTPDGEVRVVKRVYIVGASGRLIQAREAAVVGRPDLGAEGFDGATPYRLLKPDEAKAGWERMAKDILTLPRLKT